MSADINPPKKPFEDKPGWANCFKPHSTRTKAAYTGVTVIDGRKFWVNLYGKKTRQGDPYVSVHIEPFQDQPLKKDKPQEAPTQVSRGLHDE